MSPTKRRRPRRWLRAVIPFVGLAAIWAFTATAHAIEEPDRDDAGTLSPVGTGGHGSSRLAELLAGAGVRVERVSSSLQALQAAATGDATILVPAPDYLSPTFARLVALVPGAHRIVFVEPGARTLFGAGLPIFNVGERWATATLAPRCSIPFAADAGPAAVGHDRYVVDLSFVNSAMTESVDCYGGGLVGVRERGTETIYVGATDPFRNDRIAESGNGRLAMGLLSAYERVIWVDVHAREPVTLSPVGVPPPPDLPQYRRGDQPRSNTGDPTIDAFPAAFWAALLLAIGAGVLLALARARRLGPPVAEPLPVLVPAAEAVTGRGRLYARIRARGATLDALRAAAITRMARVLNPLGGPAPERHLVGRGQSRAVEAFIADIVSRTSASEQMVRTILYGPEPDDDGDLGHAVADLDRLEQAILSHAPLRSVPSQAAPPAAETSPSPPHPPTSQGGAP